MDYHHYKKPKKGKRYKGVFRVKNSYGSEYIIAKITFNKKVYTIGSFCSEEKAAYAYNIVAKMFFGKNAYLNKIHQS
jgi:hypothetical protein